jgi:hypothetical protein
MTAVIFLEYAVDALIRASWQGAILGIIVTMLVYRAVPQCDCEGFYEDVGWYRMEPHRRR